MSIKISNSSIINFSSLLVPEGEHAFLEFDFDGDMQKYSLNFIVEDPQSDNEERTPTLRFSGEENYLSITFVNWESPLGISTGKPVLVGETEEGQNVLILANVAKIGAIYKVDIQTMIGGESSAK